MEVKIDLTSLFDSAELLKMKKILNCSTDLELIKASEKIGKAAFKEMFEMILGKQLPTRANEIRERKLFLLLKYYFENYLPSEAEVSSFFQLTDGNSKSLIRDVKTKYKFELETEIKNTINNVLSSGTLASGKYTVVITSDNILEELKQTVSIEAPRLDQITKVKNSAGVYVISEDTYDILLAYYK